MTKKQYVYLSKDGAGKVFSLKEGVSKEDFKDKYESKGFTVTFCGKPPSIKTLEKYSDDGVAKTPCGCRVEPDGTCVHGNPSWMIIQGVI